MIVWNILKRNGPWNNGHVFPLKMLNIRISISLFGFHKLQIKCILRSHEVGNEILSFRHEYGLMDSSWPIPNMKLVAHSATVGNLRKFVWCNLGLAKQSQEFYTEPWIIEGNVVLTLGGWGERRQQWEQIIHLDLN